MDWAVLIVGILSFLGIIINLCYQVINRNNEKKEREKSTLIGTLYSFLDKANYVKNIKEGSASTLQKLLTDRQYLDRVFTQSFGAILSIKAGIAKVVELLTLLIKSREINQEDSKLNELIDMSIEYTDRYFEAFITALKMNLNFDNYAEYLLDDERLQDIEVKTNLMHRKLFHH